MLSFLALDGGNRFAFWCCGSEMAAGQSYFWPFLQRPHPVCQENIFHRSSSAPKTLNQFPASAASPLICATFLELYILFMRFINILICNNNNKKINPLSNSTIRETRENKQQFSKKPEANRRRS